MVQHNLDYYRKIQGMNDADSRKEAEIRLIKSELAHDFYNSLDCETATVNGASTDLLITKTSDYTIKKVVTKPDEHVYLGDIINWCDTDWIVDTIDADDRINTHAKMRRCNVILKWMDDKGVIRAYSGFCEDATKYGEGVEGGKMMQVPDFQIKVKIHLDEHSVKINRDRRFLLDAAQYLPQMEASGGHPSAFIVTRRNVLTGSHAGHGYVELTLNECAFSDRDNPELMIADYYADDDVYTLTINNAGENLTLAKDAEFTLSCTATKNGVTLNQTGILFQSSDTSIATVSTTGKIRGVANGTCVITVKAGNVKKLVEVLVYNSVPNYVIHIDPVDGDFNIMYGTSKVVNISITSDNEALPYDLMSEIVGFYATIISASNTQVTITVPDDDSAIGSTFTLRVTEPGRDIVGEATFKIVGWW